MLSSILTLKVYAILCENRALPLSSFEISDIFSSRQHLNFSLSIYLRVWSETGVTRESIVPPEKSIILVAEKNLGKLNF